MVRDDLFGGLKLALSKGETLRKAMITLYNAGYKKEEIEDAAKLLQEQLRNKQVQLSKQFSKPKKVFKKTLQKQIKPKKISIKENQISPSKQISSYGNSLQSYQINRMTLIILISFLILLVGTLITVLLFRQSIVEFLNNLF